MARGAQIGIGIERQGGRKLDFNSIQFKICIVPKYKNTVKEHLNGQPAYGLGKWVIRNDEWILVVTIMIGMYFSGRMETINASEKEEKIWEPFLRLTQAQIENRLYIYLL